MVDKVNVRTSVHEPYKNPLEAFLEKKLLEATEYQFKPMSLFELLDFGSQKISSRAPYILNDMCSGLKDLIITDDRFPGNNPKLIRSLNGASAFYPEYLGPTLLRYIIDKRSVAEGISWLQKILSTKEASGKFISALWNVPIESEFQISDDITIVPFDSLPHSDQKQAIINSQFDNGILPVSIFWEPPSSALIVSHTVAPFVYDPADHKDDVENSKYIEYHDRLNEISLLLTLIGPRVPVLFAYWFNFDDKDHELAQLSKSRGSPILEILPNIRLENPLVLNSDEAKEIIHKFYCLCKTDQEKIKTATNRLKLALSRRDPSDSAVEASIALEILCGDTQTNEMTHKVKVRAVRFLGGNKEKRERNKEIIKVTYTMRSKLVHQGIHENKPVKISGELLSRTAITNEAGILTSEIIKKIIRSGKFPDWQSFDIHE